MGLKPVNFPLNQSIDGYMLIYTLHSSPWSARSQVAMQQTSKSVKALQKLLKNQAPTKKRVSGFCLSGHVWNRDIYIYIYYHMYIELIHIYIYISVAYQYFFNERFIGSNQVPASLRSCTCSPATSRKALRTCSWVEKSGMNMVYDYIWRFPYMGNPQNGWFIVEILLITI